MLLALLSLPYQYDVPLGSLMQQSHFVSLVWINLRKFSSKRLYYHVDSSTVIKDGKPVSCVQHLSRNAATFGTVAKKGIIVLLAKNIALIMGSPVAAVDPSWLQYLFPLHPLAPDTMDESTYMLLSIGIYLIFNNWSNNAFLHRR